MTTPVLDREAVLEAAHAAGRRAAHTRHAGGQIDPAPDPHTGPLLVRQAATAWHRGFAETREDLAKAYVPDLVKAGPEGYIHGWICVRPPCGEKPGHVKAADLAVQRDGGIVHRQSGWAIGHVARDGNGAFVAHHADGHETSHDSRTAALKAVARRHNTAAAAAPAPAAPLAALPLREDVEPAGEGDEETAKRLAAALRSGEPTVKTPGTEGIQAHTQIETFPDGSKWVHKEYPAGTYNPATELQSQANTIHDLLASRLSDAIGAGAPKIVRTSPREVYMPFLDGASVGGDAAPNKRSRALHSPAAARIGLFDALTGHQDRHSGNWMITKDGTPVPIDNNSTWEVLDGEGNLTTASPFTTGLMMEHSFGSAPLSTADLDQIGARIEAIKPAFAQAATQLEGLANDDAEYATDLFPSEMYDKTMANLAKIRAQVAAIEAKASA